MTYKNFSKYEFATMEYMNIRKQMDDDVARKKELLAEIDALEASRKIKQDLLDEA